MAGASTGHDIAILAVDLIEVDPGDVEAADALDRSVRARFEKRVLA